MNQTYLNHEAYEWEGSYAYSSIVGGFLHLQVGIISLPISRREIDGYKLPSTYTTNFLQVLYEIRALHWNRMKTKFSTVNTTSQVKFSFHQCNFFLDWTQKHKDMMKFPWMCTCFDIKSNTSQISISLNLAMSSYPCLSPLFHWCSHTLARQHLAHLSPSNSIKILSTGYDWQSFFDILFQYK
jgi:hypothetical protein